MPADLVDAGAEQPLAGRAGSSHEHALGEQVELDGQGASELHVVGQRVDERVPVAERAQQLHHADDDLRVGQARDTAMEVADRAIKIVLGDHRERRVGTALDLAREQPQVRAPALLAGHASGVNDAQHLAHAIVPPEGPPRGRPRVPGRGPGILC